jgi:hypothetical protein
MTRYEELCQAHFAWEPRQVAIDAIFRELPRKMRQALSDHLEVPTKPAPMPSLMAGHATSYVELYRPRFNENGQRTWELCPPDEYLQVDSKGICHFTIGICLEPKPEAMIASMMYLEFTIESVDEQSAELQFVKTGHKLSIDLRNPAGYPDAAALVTTYVFEGLRDPPGARGLRGPIGFERFAGG